MAEAYCVKCKAKREVKDAEQVTMKNGKHALKGKCPVCGTSVFKIGGEPGQAQGSGPAEALSQSLCP